MSTVREAFDIIAAEFIKEIWIKRSNSAELVGDTEPHYPGAFTHFVETKIDGIPVVFAMRVRLATSEMEDRLKR